MSPSLAIHRGFPLVQPRPPPVEVLSDKVEGAVSLIRRVDSAFLMRTVSAALHFGGSLESCTEDTLKRELQ